MADVVRTVGSVTGDSATISDALTWLGSNYDRATDDVAVIRLVDDEVYTANGISLSLAGTATSTSYIRLEAGPGVECGGRYQGARLENASGGNGALVMAEDFIHVKGVAIKVTSSSSSRECIRLSSGNNDILIEKCYLETNNVSQQDAIYAGNFAVTNIYVFDTVIIQGGSSARAGIHAQMFSGSSTQIWHVEHCTINANGAQAGVGIRGPNTTANVYNTAAFGASNADSFSQDYERSMGGTAGTFVGTNNVSEDSSAPAEFGVLNNNFVGPLVDVDQSGNIFLVTDASVATADYSVIESTLGTHIGLGNSALGGTRDSRCDITVDVAGTARPATYSDRDRGAFQLAAAPAGVDAAGAVQIPAVTLAGVASISRTASAGLQVPALVLASSVGIARSAQAGLLAPVIEVVSAAAAERSASAEVAVSNVTLQTQADIERLLSASIFVPTVTLAASADLSRSVSGAIQNAALVLSADFAGLRNASSQMLVPLVQLAATSAAERSAGAVVTLPALVASALSSADRLASAALQMAGLELDAFVGRAGSIVASIELNPTELSAPIAVNRRAESAIQIPATQVTSAASVLRDATGLLTLSAVELSSLAGNETQVSADTEIPMPVLGSIALIERFVSGAVQSPLPTVSASASLEFRVAAAISQALVQLSSSITTPAQAGEFLLAVVRLTQEMVAEAAVDPSLKGRGDLD